MNFLTIIFVGISVIKQQLRIRIQIVVLLEVYRMIVVAFFNIG